MQKYELNLNLQGTQSRQAYYTKSGKIWPTGEFSVGYVRQEGDSPLIAGRPEISLPQDDYTDASAFGAWEPVSHLDLSNLPNSDTTTNRPEKYGKQGMTGYGKKMVKSVGALIDRYYPRHRVTFCTLTMPALPDQQRQELAQCWPKLVNELMKWLKRRLAKKGVPQVIVSVSEVQPKRLSDTGEGYLHLHLLWLNPPGRKGNWSVDVINLRAWVSEWLQRRGLWTSEAHVNADTRPVKGQKAAYLAKYCSKGGDVVAEFADDNGWAAVPGQWWNMTNDARKWVKEHTCGGQTAGELIDSVLNYSWDTGDFDHFQYVYHVEANIGGVMVNVGWRGCLTETARAQLVDDILKFS